MALLLSFVITAFSASEATAATFTVTNTANSGAGSLRQAITDANNAAGSDTIALQHRSGRCPVPTISPTSSLPAVTGTTTIDAHDAAGLFGH